jgi:hypothetical protein
MSEPATADAPWHSSPYVAMGTCRGTGGPAVTTENIYSTNKTKHLLAR